MIPARIEILSRDLVTMHLIEHHLCEWPDCSKTPEFRCSAGPIKTDTHAHSSFSRESCRSHAEEFARLLGLKLPVRKGRKGAQP